jgi:threonyl-tRNA synthetase
MPQLVLTDRAFMPSFDAAHVLAEAVQELYPGTQVTIGPAIENGFYYDFARNQPFTPEDFPAIEAKMREIVAAAPEFVRQVMDREGDRVLQGQGRAVQGRADPGFAGERGDHALSPGRLDRSVPRPAHALDRRCRHRVQADEGRRRLLARRSPQRDAVSASTAPPGATRRSSTPICTMLEEAESATIAASARRWTCSISRRKPPAVFWHPKGWKLYRTSEDYMRRRLDAAATRR